MRVHDCNWQMLEEYLKRDNRIVLRIADSALRGASETCRARFEKTFLRTMASWLVDADKRLSTIP